VNELKVDPKFASFVLIDFIKRLKKEGLDCTLLTQANYFEIFQKYQNGDLVKEGILKTIRTALEKGMYSSEILPTPCINPELSVIIDEGKKKLQNIPINKPEHQKEILMGIIMPKLCGRISGKHVSELLNL
jgi:Glu-tRNA(Gln) amidotransferase subunit E-like FAD-binding protein